MTKTNTASPLIQRSSSKLNAFRAAILGANDGIISIAGLVIGVASATTSSPTIIAAGIAGLVAGALSMAVGEYISVSGQRDSQRVLLETERKQLEANPEEEFEELIQMYQLKGLSRSTAEKVAHELTSEDAFAAHVAVELNIDPSDLINPYHAAFASTISFSLGGSIPLLAIVLFPSSYRIPETFAAVVIALVVTGLLSAKFSGAHKAKSVLRVLIGGVIAMLVTLGIGSLIGSTHF